MITTRAYGQGVQRVVAVSTECDGCAVALPSFTLAESGEGNLDVRGQTEAAKRLRASGWTFSAGGRVACTACQPKVKAARPDWDAYFMSIAEAVATRATCARKKVGAVVVADKRILSTGYNGSLPGQPHCTDVGCMMEEGHCVRTIHAEHNCLLQAARHGVSVAGTTIYTTASPCFPCFKAIATAGVAKIVFGELYRDERIREFARAAGIELVDRSGA